jgi:hypothetical protein
MLAELHGNNPLSFQAIDTDARKMLVGLHGEGTVQILSVPFDGSNLSSPFVRAMTSDAARAA